MRNKQRPTTCTDCPLSSRSSGYVPADGPTSARILLIGQAAGRIEAREGRPFSGPAGSMLDHILRYCGMDRSEVRVDNCCRCWPPSDYLDGAPWEEGAINSCRPNLDATLAEGWDVVMPMGAIPIRRIFGFTHTQWRQAKMRVENFHGTISRDTLDRFWIVPTYHPSHLRRGAHNLIGTSIFDMMTAQRIAAKGHTPIEPKLLLDPTIKDFIEWESGIHRRIDAGETPWLATDIETPEKQKGIDEEDLDVADASYIIIRVNLAYSKDVAVTVPFQEPYKTRIKHLMANDRVRKVFWAKDYDQPRLEHPMNDCPVAEPCHDAMWMWHVLQSSTPKGLGFVSPFYSTGGPWKHKYGTEFVEYAALDAYHTICNTLGIYEDLIKQDMLSVYERHIYDYDRLALKPAEKVGLKFDRGDAEKGTGLAGFEKDIAADKEKVTAEIAALIPKEVLPLEKPRKTPPEEDGYVTRTEDVLGYVCRSCEKSDVLKTHKCKEGGDISPEDITITRYYRRGEFNPGSWQQVLTYMKAKGHQPGRQKKSKKDTTDKDTLKSLAKRTRDPIYEHFLTYRAFSKVKGTYVDGMLRRMDDEDRVHPTFGHNASTLRDTCKNPSFHNLISKDKREDKYRLGERFRQCVIAEAGCKLLELDFSGIEAIQVGWFAGDPDYIRLSKLGMHAFVSSHLLRRPADRSWPDDQLRSYLKEIKGSDRISYERAKRAVHGISYGLTAYGLQQTYPDLYPTLVSAQRVLDLILKDIAPKIKTWQTAVIHRAHRQHYLGGSEHPYRYMLWLWNVIEYKSIPTSLYHSKLASGAPVWIDPTSGKTFALILGDDAKKSIAFYPQSTAGGNIKEACLRLFNPDHESFIGDAYFGRTPLRMPIHDSLVLEVPDAKVDRVIECVSREMTRPIEAQPCPEEWGMGSHLTIGVGIELGRTWSLMEEVKLC